VFSVLTNNQIIIERLAACFSWRFYCRPRTGFTIAPFIRSFRTAFDFVCQARLAKDN